MADEAPDGFTLVAEVPGADPSTQPIRTAKLTIGRDDDNDVVLKRGTVSRKHAELYFRRGRFVVVDLVRDDGMTVGGKVVNHTRAVQPGEKIDIGGCTLSIEETAALESAAARESHDDPVFRAELRRRAEAADWLGVVRMLEQLENRHADDEGVGVWRFVRDQYESALEHAVVRRPEPMLEAELRGRLSLVYKDRLQDKRRAHEALKIARKLDRDRWGRAAPPPRPAPTYVEAETTEQVALPPRPQVSADATDRVPLASTHVAHDDLDATDEIEMDLPPDSDR